jgi:hypothetical protein
MNGTSVGDIVAGIVIAWIIIKVLERVGGLLETALRRCGWINR